MEINHRMESSMRLLTLSLRHRVFVRNIRENKTGDHADLNLELNVGLCKIFQPRFVMIKFNMHTHTESCAGVRCCSISFGSGRA